MYDDLLNLGLTPRKSLILPNILNNIPYEYRDAFIIGYFDGDGSIVHPKERMKSTGKIYPSHRTTISIRGTSQLLTGMTEHLELNNKLTYNKTYILNIGNKKDVVRFLKCYNNLTFFLQRKYDKLVLRMNHSSYNELIQAQTISSPFPHF